MNKVQVHSAGTKVCIDREKNEVSVLYPGNLDSRDHVSLDADWVKKYQSCRVCGKPVDDDHFALAYWRHEQQVCSSECLRLENLQRHACCNKAVQKGCVCAYATDCPEHGERHFGTHD